MILIHSKFLVKTLSFGTAKAMALYPFVLFSEKDLPEYILNHEKIHLRQQLELLILPFYLWYFAEFLIQFLKYRNRKEAYMNISFEREAYQNHFDLEYLKNRKWFGFLAFV